MKITKRILFAVLGLALSASAFAAEPLGEKSDTSCEGKSDRVMPPSDASAAKIEVQDDKKVDSSKSSAQGK